MASRKFLEVDSKPKSVFSVIEEPDFNIEDDFNMDITPSDFKSIIPKLGFCVKAKTDDNEKMFINVCHSEDVPPPPESLDARKIIAGEGSDDEALFRFPLSLGEFHTELDKSGNECKCYDVVINSQYYQEVSKSVDLRDFVMTLACSGLERKYNFSIDVGTCIVLNKPYHGKMPPHYIKLKSSSNSSKSLFDKAVPDKKEDILMRVRMPPSLQAAPIPEISRYKLFQSPASGYPTLIIFQGLTKDSKSVRIYVSKRNLTLRSLKGNVIFSFELPFPIIPEKSLSNFWKNRLVVAMPVECSE